MMKQLKTGLFLLMLAVALIACKDDTEQSDYFIRGNAVRFYYVDETGAGLIDPDDPSTWPVPATQLSEIPPAVPTDISGTSYCGGVCRIESDDTEDLFYFTTGVYGDYSSDQFSMYVYFKGEADRMDILYDYSLDDPGSRNYYANIAAWRFNDMPIYSESGSSEDWGMRVVKVYVSKEEGRTTVSLEK
ncbi:hypothetical protein [uncultured Alistipes sp.]|uniref:hypothetical protein n=1 Tax=uncultured Alistipes sp. TaxID=538949 RepID=UPI002628CE72|nr:hypothetical protein [uncultured Alistipes sp.]